MVSPYSGNGSVFDVIRDEFVRLRARTPPLALPIADGLEAPERLVALRELERWLFDPACASTVWDAVWAQLVRATRTGRRRDWVAVCLGLARPLLLVDARRLAAAEPGAAEDIHAAVVCGFVAGLDTVALDRPMIVQRLGDRARAQGRRALRAAQARPVPVDDPAQVHGGVLAPPAGHPEQVLAEAVAAGALTAAQAELIAATRLQHRSLREHAQATGRGYAAVRKARARAEHALHDFLHPACAETRGCPKTTVARAVEDCGTTKSPASSPASKENH